MQLAKDTDSFERDAEGDASDHLRSDSSGFDPEQFETGQNQEWAATLADELEARGEQELDPFEEHFHPDSPGGEPFEEETATKAGGSTPSKRKRKRRLILLTLLGLAIAGGGYEGYHWWTDGRFQTSTDDAYLAADMSILSAKVSGYITAVEVRENQAVACGDVIARIDDGDYRLAVQSAKDKITVQQAVVDRIAVQIEASRAGVEEAAANIKSAEATLALTASELGRKSKLAKSDFATRSALDTARADHDRAVAALAAAKAAKTSAEASVAVLAAERSEALATLGSLQTALKQAERDLAFTLVRAPLDGVVGNRAVDVGEFVQPGSRIAAVVPLDQVYVEANFKETQLEKMHAGQRASVTVDSFPGKVFAGEVASLSPASGAVFSLLPPENATGNFTKIVQRLPVRISLSKAAIDSHALRPGMSAVVTVDSREGADASLAPATELVVAGAATGCSAGRVN